MIALRINDSEVPPSGVLQTGRPLFHCLVAFGVGPIPSVEGAGHKKFLSGSLDGGIGKDCAGILTSLSSTPFDKVGKYWLSSLSRNVDGNLVITMTSIRREIDVLDGSKLDIGVGWHWRNGGKHVVVVVASRLH